MKKFLVSVLAIAGLVACNQEQTIVQQGPAPMEFAGAFVENATRAIDPSITTDKLNAFDVWAYVEEKAGTVLTKERVTRVDDTKWTYYNKQYWTPNHDYYFTAIAPVDTNHWTYNQAEDKLDFSNEVVAGAEDLIYAYKKVATPATINQGMPAVDLQFEHLLSKVNFKFKNGFATENVSIVVKGVQMTAPKAGTYQIAGAGQNDTTTGEWILGEGSVDLIFGDVEQLSNGASASAANERLTIPASAQQLYTVSFTIELYNGTVQVQSFDKVSTITGVELEKGKAYNFVAEITPENLDLTSIEFALEKVAGWVDGGQNDFVPATPVATAQELVAALEAGSNVTLTQDINLDSVATTRASYGLIIEKDCVLDGAGHVITTSASRAIAVSGANDVTLKNFTLNATGERGLQVQGGAKKVTIENVTATSANYTVSLPKSAGATNVVINNCDLKGLNTINVAAPGAVVTVNDTIIRCEDNNSAESYAAISIHADGKNANVYVNGGEVIISGSHTTGTDAGSIAAEGANISFNGTAGDPQIEGRYFAIEYGDYSYVFSSFEGALEKAVDGETIKLLQDVTVESPIVVNKNITFDLNGKTLTAAAEDKAIDAIWVRDDAEVVITGNGTINATFDALFATGNSKVTIENGAFTGAAEAVYVQANASVEILGGSFKSTQYPEFTLNIKDTARATASIVVKGGQYYQFDPANNEAEGANTSFVAPGYKSVQNGDWFEVVEE